MQNTSKTATLNSVSSAKGGDYTYFRSKWKVDSH